jgi:agarase
MRRAVILSFLILLAGVWFQPHLSGAGTASTATDGYDLTPPTPATSASPARILTTATRQPTTQPSPFKQVRGADHFWRIAQTPAGVWWFLSPDGKPEFLNSVTTVQPFQMARDKDGPAYLSTDYDGGLDYNGHLDAWADKTLARVKSYGFKGLGAWSHPVFHKTDVPMTRDLNVWSWMHGNARRFYSHEFGALAEQAIRTQVEPLRDNRSLVGYFIDNELDWGDAASGPGVYFDFLPANDPNRTEVVRVIKSVWATLDQFNQDWKLKVKDWKELDTWNALPRAPQQSYARLFSAWLGHLAEDYFRLTTTLIHKYDQNHLILGVRFKGWAMREVVQASRGYTDVVSLNYYPADAKLDPEMFRMMHEVSGQPIMLSEYSFHALDGRSGNRNTVGFYAQVLDQQARADGYRLMTTRLARVPYIVGADWFQWNDEPPSGRANDGEDANFGVVDVDDKPYQPLVDAVRDTTPLLNGLHDKSPKDAGQDIWRETFADKPVARVPYLSKPIRVNGELSDWPKEAKIQGIRHSPTVGLDRSKLPLPNVYLGWREEGIYLGAEVFDTDIVGAPAQGWWWTRDNFEFWISTKPVASDQNAYDAYCHQFFFVPNSFPGDDGVAGTVGQLKRDGDALKDSLIPQPDIKQVTRIFPDRYVVEIFIPNKALKGYDPKKQNALAFNIHFRNFQHALDYFWSAPKDVLTQLRPNTWGPVYLEPPAGAKVIEAMKTPAPRPAAPATQPTATASVN